MLTWLPHPSTHIILYISQSKNWSPWSCWPGPLKCWSFCILISLTKTLPFAGLDKLTSLLFLKWVKHTYTLGLLHMLFILSWKLPVCSCMFLQLPVCLTPTIHISAQMFEISMKPSLDTIYKIATLPLEYIHTSLPLCGLFMHNMIQYKMHLSICLLTVFSPLTYKHLKNRDFVLFSVFPEFKMAYYARGALWIFVEWINIKQINE